MKLDDTIVAISTPLGSGGLGIVRMSGENSLTITKRIFKPYKKNSTLKANRSVLGKLYQFEKKEFFEEAYVTFFKKPKTYTREDMVEISCHGSPVILEEVIRLCMKSGARHADPGEFTLRAYINGRIDILQAEAINNLIHATSFKHAKISFNHLDGKLSHKIESFREQIVHILSQIEASIEFPEENLHLSKKMILKTINTAVDSLNRLIQSYELGKTIKQGFVLAIAGRTNTGKSTLFNALLDQERAIVSSYPGTTRDYLQERIKINDISFILTDIAGTDIHMHPPDKEAIKKGQKLAQNADGVLILFDSSQKETEDDLKLIAKFKDRKSFLLFNKIDLIPKINKDNIIKNAKGIHSLEISALKGTNLDKLRTVLYECFKSQSFHEDEIILNLRQKLLLEDIASNLRESRRLLEEGYSEETYVEEIRKNIPLLGQLTGEIRTNEVIEQIFNRFCVGK
ncbi:MAG: tRNA uridine-5-carboxymethylaminomethyl(34) synthesis GTPase MnmE [Candidatus Aminicenantaceae bacterium]